MNFLKAAREAAAAVGGTGAVERTAWCSWCFRNTMHCLKESRIGRNLFTCSGCNKEGRVCFLCQNMAKSHKNGILSGEARCAVCDGTVTVWGEKPVLPSLLDVWCSWCQAENGHTLVKKSLVPKIRSTYECDGCGNLGLLCRYCQHATARSNPIYDEELCIVCDGSKDDWRGLGSKRRGTLKRPFKLLACVMNSDNAVGVVPCCSEDSATHSDEQDDDVTVDNSTCTEDVPTTTTLVRQASTVTRVEVSISPSLQVITHDELELDAEPLGRGGHGTVYHATHLGGDCAVKFLGDALSSTQVQSFVDEAALLAGLRHPHCVLYMGIYHDPTSGRLGLVTEFMAGGDMSTFIRSEGYSSVPLRTKVELMLDAVRGLIYLHARELAHRDIKSPNVLLSHRERLFPIKLADFGLSGGHGLGRDDARGVMSYRYAPPEVLSGTQSADAKCDVYSFGCMLYEVFTASAPWCNLRHGADRMHNVYSPPGDFRAVDVSDDLLLLLKACCSTEREERPSAAQLAKSFEHYLET